MSAALDVPDVAGADCLHDRAAVESALDRMAAAIDAGLAGDDCLVLALLHGGLVPAGLLLPRMRSPLQLDTVHVTRYRGATRGGEVAWHATPRTPVAGRRVVVVDDILDEGYSLAAVRDWLREAGAAEVRIAVLVEKRHDRKVAGLDADVRGLEVPDRYVFGYGMDYRGWHRNAAGIFALAPEAGAAQPSAKEAR